MIKVSNLTKRFGKTAAVDEINFEIGNGDIVGLLGPNGAGKTTTMRLLTGYLLPDSGGVTIDGNNFSGKEREIKKVIGYMPENNPLYDDMLVYEFLKFIYELSLEDKTKFDERLAFVSKAVGITDKMRNIIGELSKGYKQRVGLAATLINDPKILVLDEPTEGLDPNQRNDVRSLIKTLGKNRTVIISTHVMQEVEAMCNKIIIINNGKIVAFGTRDEVLNLKKGVKTITVTLSGNNVETNVKSLKNTKILNSSFETSKKTYTIETDKSNEKIYEEFSMLIAKNKWSIYRLETKTQSLEELFSEVTQTNK